MGDIIARSLTFVALASMVLWSSAGVVDYGRHVVDLWGRSVGEKGAIAIDGPVGTGWRAQARAAGKTPTYSPWADVWLWTFEKSEQVGSDSDIYLNLPSPILYYYGTFFWHPSRLRVDAGGIPITNYETLAKTHVFDPSEFESLRDQGFEYVVAQTPDGFGLIPLGDEPWSEPP